MNYRKLVGDIYRGYTTPLPDLINYFNVPVLIIRILKSEVVVGLREKDIPDRESREWLYNGKYGLIDFYDGS